MSALIGFGKIIHELKNRQAAERHLNLGRSPIPTNCSERKMVGVWWARSRSSPGAMGSQPQRQLLTHLQVSAALHLGLSSTGADKHCQVLVILVFVPFFKTFLISYLVPALRTGQAARGRGSVVYCKSRRREAGERAAEELPSKLLPDVQVSSICFIVW